MTTDLEHDYKKADTVRALLLDIIKYDDTRTLAESMSALSWRLTIFAARAKMLMGVSDTERLEAENLILRTAISRACHDGWADGDGAMRSYLREVDV